MSEKVAMAAVVGMPEIAPAAPKVSPAGNVPLATLQVMVPTPPLDARLALYAVPTTPLDMVAVVRALL